MGNRECLTTVVVMVSGLCLMDGHQDVPNIWLPSAMMEEEVGVQIHLLVYHPVRGALSRI